MNIRFRSTLLLTSAAGALTLSGAPALAQQADPVTQLDEIVVTAQLRAQDPVEVPFALTAYSGERLQQLGLQDFEALSAFVPGFLVQNQSPNNPGFVMRGITSDDGAATTEPRVSVFQDGVSISKARGSFVELFDLERVEVAKGPQSTLYGRGALIGAVNLVQNRARPGVTDSAASIWAGNYGSVGAELMINAPLGDSVGLRFATRLKRMDGTVENLLGGPDYNSVNTQAYRLGLAFEPNDAFRFDVIANYQVDDTSGTSFKSIAYNPADPVTGAVLGGRDPWDGAALTSTADFDGGKVLGLDREVWGVTGLGRLELSPSLTLNSTSAYRRFDSYETFDADGVSLPILSAAEEAFGEQWSQDLRLNFDNGGRVSAFVGGGWFREEGYQRTPTQFAERLALAQLAGLLDGNPAAVGTNTLPASVYGSSALLNPILAGFGLPGPAIPGIAANLKPAHIETATNSSELTSWDVFGDLTFRLTDRFEVSGGLRYTRDDKTTGFASELNNGRSILGGLLAVQQVQAQIATLIAIGTPEALTQAAALGAFANGVVGGLATPGSVGLPPSAGFPPFGLTSQPTQNNGDFVYGDLEDDGMTWRFTARYAVSDNASLYANYARGRRPKVLSARSPSTPLGNPTFTEVDAETVDSFELGAKYASADGRLQLDGAVYRYDYENFQTTIQDGTRFIVTNAGEASAWGFEGQVAFLATDTVELFGTYGYNHSRFESGIYDGNRFRLSPDHMASIGAVWTLPVRGGAFEVQPTYTWQSKVFFSDDNDIPALQVSNFVPDTTQDEFQDAYGLLNLRIRFQPDSRNWSLEAYGENLLDEEYVKDAGNTGDALGMPTFIAGRPMTWGLSARLRY